MAHTADHDPTSHYHAHLVPIRVLVGVLLALLFLTVITIIAAKLYLGIWVALLIAAAKAALVLLWFMHLRYDSPVNSVILVGTMIFIVLFIGMSLNDTRDNQALVDPLEEQMQYME